MLSSTKDQRSDGTSHLDDAEQNVIEVPMSIIGKVVGSHQPFTFGVPMKRGTSSDIDRWGIVQGDKDPVEIQTSSLVHWDDGSLKWLTADFSSSQIDLADTDPLLLRRLEPHHKFVPLNQQPRVEIKQTDHGVFVRTESTTFVIESGGALLREFDSNEGGWLGEDGCRIICHDARGRSHVGAVSETVIEEYGPMRATVAVRGTVGTTCLTFAGSLSFFAGSNLIRCKLTIENPQRAKHLGGFWDLGDPGSVNLTDLSLNIAIGDEVRPEVQYVCERTGSPKSLVGQSLEIHQDTSGGKQWRSRSHVNHLGVTQGTFAGYRVLAGDQEHHGLRAEPIVGVNGKRKMLVATLEEFWQQFPSSMKVSDGNLSIGLWPCQPGDQHELQGGEWNTRTVWLNVAERQKLSCMDLRWAHSKAQVVVQPKWTAATNAIPFFTKKQRRQRKELSEIYENAIKGPNSFFKKRETVDEYGWRNFGDVWADHETVYCHDCPPVISHYNNQYDLLHSFLVQYLKTGDARWWRLADPLARHIIDIDIYHTQSDKAAYCGGMFWHTAHYLDAGTGSHRSYSRDMIGNQVETHGGGPSNEHNYSSGLCLYWLLTGNRQARDVAIGLADWVIAMDDGSLHPLGAINESSTGLASCTGSPEGQNPGRGLGNSILVLLNAWQIDSENNDRYLAKAIELMCRSMHPNDDLTGNELLNAELRWSYTVAIQSLICLMEATKHLPDHQDSREYARQCVLHYARWMAKHERMTLDHPDELEYPTETWAAQDLRKGVVLMMAASISSNAAERECFLSKANQINDNAWRLLKQFRSRHFARPVAVIMQQAYLQPWFTSICQRKESVQSEDTSCDSDDLELASRFPQRRAFQTQRAVVRAAIASPRSYVDLIAHASRPGPWLNAWRRSWASQKLRILAAKFRS